MTAITTRKTVRAIVEEVAEGTLKAPGATSDYLAIQPDFTLSPNFDTLENAELKDSIVKAQSIPGNENPTAGGSHYLRHSGTEGATPDHRLVLKGAFGSETVNGTQYLTQASSTTSIIKTTTASTNFVRGQAVLVKDGTNGYSIRVVESTTATDLVLGFNLTAAPAAGVGLGKAIAYLPVNDGHPSLSVWDYLGNAGAVRAMAGGKVESLTMPFASGQLINMQYSIAGTSFYFNPIEITSSTRYLDFTDDDGTFAAVVATGFYKDPEDLASALTTAMNTANSGETHTVTYSSSTGKFTIVSTGTVLSLLWNTGTNTANTIGTKIGFSVAADDTGVAAATGYTSDNAQVLSAPQTGVYDTAQPVAAKGMDIMMGTSSTDNGCAHASAVTWTFTNTVAKTLDLCQVSGFEGSIVSERAVSVAFTAKLNQYDVANFSRYRRGDTVRLQNTFGVKAGGNWVPGKCGVVYLSTGVITAFDIVDQDGLATLQATILGFGVPGQVESSLNLL